MDTATPLISMEKTEAWLLHFLSDIWVTAQAQTERDDSLTVENLLVAVLQTLWANYTLL